MADRYWVGGTGTWDGTSTANWSATDAGAPGASAPTSADNVFIRATSGTGVITATASATCAACSFITANISLQLSGSPTFAGTLTFLTGTITLGSNTLSCLSFSSGGTSTRNIDFGTGAITVTGSGPSLFSITGATGLTLTGTPVVNISNNSSTASTIQTPTLPEATSISFNITTGTYTLSASTSTVVNLNFTGFAGTYAPSATTIFGSLTLSSGMTASSASTLTFGSTSGVKTITSNGRTLDCPVTFNGVGGTWRLQDALSIGATRIVTLTNGAFDANNFNVSLGTFRLGAGTKTLTLGSGTWTVLGSGSSAWNCTTSAAGLTVSASTATISMNSAVAKTFSGGGFTWPTLNQGGAGMLTIANSSTFANITDTAQPATIRFTSGTTQTVSAFGVSGTSGNLVTLDTTVAGSQATLSDASGTNAVSFVSIKDIAATGGATWNAPVTSGNIDAGNNTGWNFSAGPSPSVSVEPSIALRSFTERKHF